MTETLTTHAEALERGTQMRILRRDLSDACRDQATFQWDHDRYEKYNGKGLAFTVHVYNPCGYVEIPVGQFLVPEVTNVMLDEPSGAAHFVTARLLRVENGMARFEVCDA